MEFKHNGITIKDKKSIANTFNKYFINVGQSLASKIPNSKINPVAQIKVNIIETFSLHRRPMKKLAKYWVILKTVPLAGMISVPKL